MHMQARTHTHQHTHVQAHTYTHSLSLLATHTNTHKHTQTTPKYINTSTLTEIHPRRYTCMHALKITHTLAHVQMNTQALRPSHFAKLLRCTKPRAVGAYGCKNRHGRRRRRRAAGLGEGVSLDAQTSPRVSGAPARRSGPRISQHSCTGQNPAPWAPDGHKNSAAAGRGGLQASRNV